jgi:hypothetical protein
MGVSGSASFSRWFFGKKLECDGAPQPGVFGLIDNTHTAATELLQDAVMGNRFAGHGSGMFRILMI